MIAIRDRLIAVGLLVWLLGGAFLYYLRFSVHFYGEHFDAIRALMDRIF